MAQLAINSETRPEEEPNPIPRRRKSALMPSLTTSYLIPAILLNPAFVLHLINTFVSHLTNPLRALASTSPHPFMESLGPIPPTPPHLDMHADDALCWRYTAVMVVVQLLAFGRVQDNRVRRKERRAERKEKLERDRLVKLERERLVKEKVEREAEWRMRKDTARQEVNGVARNGKLRNTASETLFDDENANPNGTKMTPGHVKRLSGEANTKTKDDEHSDTDNSSESSLTGTSEEEMIV